MGGLCEAHPLLISHVISLKWQGAIAFFLGPIASSCYEQRWDPLACIIVNYPFGKWGCCVLEILPGSSLVTQRDNQMLNKQEINSSFPFSFPHKRWVCFCWSFACVKAAVWSQCVLSHLTFGMSEGSLWREQKAFSDGGICWACLQCGGGLGGAECRGTSRTLKHWKTNSSQMKQM